MVELCTHHRSMVRLYTHQHSMEQLYTHKHSINGTVVHTPPLNITAVYTPPLNGTAVYIPALNQWYSCVHTTAQWYSYIHTSTQSMVQLCTHHRSMVQMCHNTAQWYSCIHTSIQLMVQLCTHHRSMIQLCTHQHSTRSRLTLSTLLNLVPILRIRGSVPPSRTYIFMPCIFVTNQFLLTCSVVTQVTSSCSNFFLLLYPDVNFSSFNLGDPRVSVLTSRNIRCEVVFRLWCWYLDPHQRMLSPTHFPVHHATWCWYLDPHQRMLSTTHFPVHQATGKYSASSQGPCCARRRFSSARLLGWRVRIPPGAWMFVCSVYCVLCR